jgi:intraflagellar transport protein 52
MPRRASSRTRGARSGGGDGDSKKPTVIFDLSKKEVNKFKRLQRKLRSTTDLAVNKNPIDAKTLSACKLFVLAGPKAMFKTSEISAMQNFLKEGGSILLMAPEGGDERNGSNFNFFLENYGIEVNTDSVVRTSFDTYLHPKEVLIRDGVVNREINVAAGKKLKGRDDFDVEKKSETTLTYVYPYGSTLNVAPPAIPVLSTGNIAYPVTRPTAAFFKSSKGGRLVVLGSANVFLDDWLEEQENSKLQEVLFRWLLDGSWEVDEIDAKNPELADYNYLPNTEGLAEQLRACLQDTEDVPKDYNQLFDDTMFAFNTSGIVEVASTYEELGVKHEPLTLIPPQFEVPMPPLQPAVFPPIPNELPAPVLDLFDLDEQFASEKVRLARLTTSCGEDDLDMYIKEAGEMLGVMQKLPADQREAKNVLEYILKHVVNWKKLNPAPPTDVM